MILKIIYFSVTISKDTQELHSKLHQKITRNKLRKKSHCPNDKSWSLVGSVLGSQPQQGGGV